MLEIILYMIGEQEIHLYFKYKTSAVIEKFPHAWCKTDTSVLVSFLPTITITIKINNNNNNDNNTCLVQDWHIGVGEFSTKVESRVRGWSQQRFQVHLHNDNSNSNDDTYMTKESSSQ